MRVDQECPEGRVHVVIKPEGEKKAKAFLAEHIEKAVNDILNIPEIQAGFADGTFRNDYTFGLYRQLPVFKIGHAQISRLSDFQQYYCAERDLQSINPRVAIIFDFQKEPTSDSVFASPGIPNKSIFANPKVPRFLELAFQASLADEDTCEEQSDESGIRYRHVDYVPGDTAGSIKAIAFQLNLHMVFDAADLVVTIK